MNVGTWGDVDEWNTGGTGSVSERSGRAGNDVRPDAGAPVEEDSAAETALLRHLTREFAAEASRREQTDAVFTTTETPVGTLLLAATSRGLVRVAYQAEVFDHVLESLSADLGSRILEVPEFEDSHGIEIPASSLHIDIAIPELAVLDRAAKQIDEYFAGERTEFDLLLDRRLSHGFLREVQEFLPSISYGSTRSYKEVAADVGRPKAVRAVGTACARNPLPVVVPCHRVLRSDGSTGEYLGGREVKKTLLSLEKSHAA